ncbi:MAG: Queuine tRNA-ribosyltransferase [Parcubacteria group bacterium GW2011_GWA2_56_7]|nr:MAG: Queuine tRNA-ribosyltransferase [Parcubacteria group bacterium GW2011_GWA2_56_7]
MRRGDNAMRVRYACTRMFQIKQTKGRRRVGELTTAHGVIETPFFMPIATKGAVKTLSSQDMRDLGAQILLSNTYHLLLRPGLEEMKRLGGLHRFMNWGGPILTDSGGYQVFSLGNLNKITDDGVRFQSHIDGSYIDLTPELSVQMQLAIGSDIIMQFDDVAAGNSTKERYGEAMERSLVWAERCKAECQKSKGSSQLFGIVQGGTHEDLRAQSLEGLQKTGFDGYAIGGLSVGEAREDAYRIVSTLTDRMPSDAPRYFMGGGMPEEIVYYVHQGVDMFDCVLPTRNARHGTLFVWKEDPSAIEWREDKVDFYDQIRITNEEFKFSQEPLDLFMSVPALQGVTRAYLRHLFTMDEMLGYRLATIQNLAFYLRLMKELRHL